MGAERILIIEDDPEIQEMLKYSFAQEGWILSMAGTGEEGLEQLREDGADCVILDIMLPGMDGYKTLKKIREDESFRVLPVILCTARGEEADIVAGLELGADDYVVKPYSPRVLAARIRAGLRRKESAGSNEKTAVLRHGALSLDVERHTTFLGEEPLDLYATEFAILAQFMRNPDIVFSRQKLITAIRGPDYPVTDRSVDVQILGLRKKLGEAGEMIETIRGVGYRFKTQ
ncbi:MAG: response regulator transcription factor [Treponema sp.]|jgi:two-component system phosphate regulon response regulator PhoB|nr:response regulator transcription factor [Treponema sp.]